MIVVHSRNELQKRLAEWPDADEATSWALAFGSALPTPGELMAMREAAKTCDRLVVARLLPDRVLPPTYAGVVEEAGGDVLWCPREVSGHVRLDVGVEGVDTVAATLMLQAVATVLPNLVVVEKAHLALVRAMRNIQNGLGDMFTLRVV